MPTLGVDEVKAIRSSMAYRALARTVRREEQTCWLCGGDIDLTIPYRDPDTKRINKMSWSMDHIKPMSEYPDLALERSNVRAAHYRCNSSRGNRTPVKPPPPLRVSRRWALPS